MKQRISTQEQLVVPLEKKLFICENDPSRSFFFELDKFQIQSLEVGELLSKVKIYFNAQKSNRNYHIDDNSFHISIPKYCPRNQLLVNTPFNILPIYFKTKKVLFEIQVIYQDQKLPYVLKCDQNEDYLLNLISKGLKLPRNQIYFLFNKQFLDKDLQNYKKVDLQFVKDKIKVNGITYLVDLQLSLKKNRNLLEYINLHEDRYQYHPVFEDKSLKELGIKPDLNSKLFTFDCDFDETYDSAIQQVCDRLNYPFENIYYPCRFNKNLQIQPDQRIIDLLVRIRGGDLSNEINNKNFQFVDLENEGQKKQLNFSKQAPKYRIACHGINLEGHCKNKECEYYNKLVIAQIGYKSIEIFQDIYEEIKCPNSSCGENISLVTCGFTNCLYSWNGLKVVDGKIKHVRSSQIIAKSDKYTRYDPTNENGSSNSAKWKQIFIQAREIPKGNNYCFICNQEIVRREDECSSEICLEQANHKCHSSCKSKMSLLPNKCLMCLTTTTG